jgi:ABC-type branched-subunit amino acid transport system ATPase component
MTVLDNILVILTSRHVVSSLFEKHDSYHLKKAEDILNVVGLWDKRHQLAHNLSYGQRKLLEIARVLAMDAKIILLDEPFAGLFPEMIKTVVKVINNLKQQGRTIILIEHNMALIRELCDHLFVLDGGELLAHGKPNEVLKEKKVIEAYLGE